MSSSRPRNIVGPRIRELRVQRGWSQATLVAKCNLAGWALSRETLAKIEAQIRWVGDFEMVFLSSVFEVPVQELLLGVTFSRVKTIIESKI